MGGEQAAKVLLQIEEASLKSKGEEIDEVKHAELLRSVTERYNKQTSPYYAAARLWVDAIINPEDTRKWISMGIEAANHAPITKEFRPGVIRA
jgi:acetyl-CoA carboxylase carboxyltransferase component